MHARNASLALPEKDASRAAFARAASTFGDACVVHDWARQQVLERLDVVRLIPATVADIGCAVGRGTAALARRYPLARRVAVDSSVAMLATGRQAAPEAAAAWLAGDAERLPLKDGCIDLLLANLVLPWCSPAAFFAEARRVLRPDGLVTFATLGPDTLQEVRRAWLRADDVVHVHAAFDMHDLGDAAVAAGLAEPVLDVDRIEVAYRDVDALVADLRACGAVNTAPGRRKSLTGPRRWRTFADTLHARRIDDRFVVTIEVIFGQAWGRPARMARTPAGETVVPLAHVQRKRAGRLHGAAPVL